MELKIRFERMRTVLSLAYKASAIGHYATSANSVELLYGESDIRTGEPRVGHIVWRCPWVNRAREGNPDDNTDTRCVVLLVADVEFESTTFSL